MAINTPVRLEVIIRVKIAEESMVLAKSAGGVPKATAIKSGDKNSIICVKRSQKAVAASPGQEFESNELRGFRIAK